MVCLTLEHFSRAGSIADLGLAPRSFVDCLRRFIKWVVTERGKFAFGLETQFGKFEFGRCWIFC